MPCEPFNGLANFEELVVIQSDEAPRNILLSTSGDDPIVGQRGAFYVWRRNNEFQEPTETQRVPLQNNPMFNELVVIESVGTHRNILLSTSDNTPIVYCLAQGNKLFSWRPATAVPAVSPIGVAAGVAALAAAAAKVLKNRDPKQGAADRPE
jgi:hypothetical protein